VTTGEKKFEDEVDNESANGERLTRVLTKWQRGDNEGVHEGDKEGDNEGDQEGRRWL
jgi:hypothetical protein